jgi:hypothetical protein
LNELVGVSGTGGPIEVVHLGAKAHDNAEAFAQPPGLTAILGELGCELPQQVDVL